MPKAHALLCFGELFIYLNLLLNVNGLQLSVFTADIQVISGEDSHSEIGIPEIDIAASVDIADTGNGVTLTVEIGRGKECTAVQGTAVGSEADDIPAPEVTGNGTVGGNQAAGSAPQDADAAKTDTGFRNGNLVVVD